MSVTVQDESDSEQSRRAQIEQARIEQARIEQTLHDHVTQLQRIQAQQSMADAGQQRELYRWWWTYYQWWWWNQYWWSRAQLASPRNFPEVREDSNASQDDEAPEMESVCNGKRMSDCGAVGIPNQSPPLPAFYDATPSGANDRTEIDAGDVHPENVIPMQDMDVCKYGSMESLQVVDAANLGHSFVVWFILVFCADAVSAVLGVVIWSMIGFGANVMVSLAEQDSMAYPVGGLAFLVIIVLYVLDFFIPPHLAPQHLALGPEGCIANTIGRIIFGFALFLIVASVCFMIKDYPHIPPLLTAFVGPLLVVLCRKVFGPEENEDVEKRKTTQHILRRLSSHTSAEETIQKDARLSATEHKKSTFGHKTNPAKKKLAPCLETSATTYLTAAELLSADGSTDTASLTKKDPEMIRHKLKIRRGKSQDARRFYGAAALGLMLVSMSVGCFWIYWWIGDKNRWNPVTRGKLREQGIDEKNFGEAKTIMFVIWASPVITACCHGLFGIMMLLRWKMHDMYVKADQFEVAVRRVLQKTNGSIYEEGYDALEEAKDLNVQITSQVRIFVSVAVGLAGCIWVASEVAGADVEAAQLVKGFVGFFMIAMVLFLAHSFQNWWREVRSIVKTSPMYQSLLGVMRSDWVRAVLVWMIGPFWPFILILSALNQKVRECRGLHDPNDWRIDKAAAGPVSSQTLEDLGQCTRTADEQAPAWLTSGVARAVLRMRIWDWTMVWNKVHWLGIIFFILNVGSAKVLNIFLSWLNSLLKDFPLELLIVVFYIVGVSCFLLPPVPGPPVYLFGGLLFASNPNLGFLNGTVMCIFICWILKLNACAMQQKCIGERLGTSEYVLSTCGVNKPTMKAIEMVLKEPGLSVGKCSILCGGPDWPTSVTCGLLRVPLHQAIIGTFPIIFFVVPCVLTGAFYVKSEEGDVFRSLATLMLTISTGVSVVLLAAATFAIQSKMDRYYDHLHRPLIKHVELDWLDHVSHECSLVATAQLSWKDFPGWVRTWHRVGAGMMLVGCHIFYWFDAACFGEFTIQTPISELSPDFIKYPMGHSGLICFFWSCLSLYFFKKYCRSRSSGPVNQLKVELAQQEESWKHDRQRWAIEADEELQATPERLPPEFRKSNGTPEDASTSI